MLSKENPAKNISEIGKKYHEAVKANFMHIASKFLVYFMVVN